MRSTSRRKGRWATAAGLVAAFAAGLAAQPLLRWGVAAWYQEDYGALVFKCDQAMREHFIAKSRVVAAPSEDSTALLAAAEVALIDCHDYDLMRKDLQRLGLQEADLAAMGLRAIERRGEDIREIVRIHEIRY